MIPDTVSRRSTLLLVAAMTLAASAHAQYTGPVEGRETREPLRTVAEVLKNPKDDHPVQLTGVLARKTGKEKYLFRDDTGEIRVEIDPEDFPHLPVNEKTRLRIVGEVDKSVLRAPEIDAKRVVLLGETP